MKNKKLIWIALFVLAFVGAVICLFNFIAAISLGCDSTAEGKSIITMWGYLLLATIGVAEIISAYCLYNLWRGKDKILTKLLWSIVLPAPFLGPISYGGFHNPPPPKADDLKAPFTGESNWEDTSAHEHVGHGDSHDFD